MTDKATTLSPVLEEDTPSMNNMKFLCVQSSVRSESVQMSQESSVQNCLIEAYLEVEGYSSSVFVN